MEKLFLYQNNLLQGVEGAFFRYPFQLILWKERLIGIKGLRGVGKTTMLVEELKYHLGFLAKHLYVSLDHPYFYTHTLYELAETFYQMGGEALLVDEVHKMRDWSGQIKTIYDGFHGLQLIFTASSALDIYRGGADLSRRVLTFSLGGLSFREYLHLYHGILIEPFTLTDLLEHHMGHAAQITALCKPLALFREYLAKGYF